MKALDYYTKHLGRAVVLSLLLLSCPTLWSQAAPAKSASAEAPPAAPADTIGRGTPRGTVLGLLSAARNRKPELAALYLNTPLRGAEAETLASQLARSHRSSTSCSAQRD